MSGEKIISIVAAEVEALPFICGKHQLRLTYVLRGGAGHCASCSMFIQSANHAEPTRDIPRPERVKAKAKKKTTRTRKAKAAPKRYPMLSTKFRNPMLEPHAKAKTAEPHAK